MYNQMPEFIPQELKYPEQKKSVEDAPGKKKNRIEALRENNGALANICEDTRNREHSAWQYFTVFADANKRSMKHKKAKNSSINPMLLAKKSPYNPDRANRLSQAANILEKVQKRNDHAKYNEIRKANVPFYCVDASKINELKDLTDEYKSFHG